MTGGGLSPLSHVTRCPRKETYPDSRHGRKTGKAAPARGGVGTNRGDLESSPEGCRPAAAGAGAAHLRAPVVRGADPVRPGPASAVARRPDASQRAGRVPVPPWADHPVLRAGSDRRVGRLSRLVPLSPRVAADAVPDRGAAGSDARTV